MAMNGELTIDLGALKRNYRSLDKRSAQTCETACVVKADCYGLGADKCAPILYDAGARSFFVATLEEGISLENRLPADAVIYVLNGLNGDKGQIELYKRHNLIPVLNALAEIQPGRKHNNSLACALHFDTGMNRLGLDEHETQKLCQNPELLKSLNVRLIISHFASSEEADNPDNPAQLVRFKKIIEKIKPLCPNARFSIANSGGLFLGEDYHLDLIRTGIALYGGHPSSSLKQNPQEPCVTISAPALQIRSAKKGETAGYNATYRFKQDTDLVIVGAGYADGLPRNLSNNGTFYWKDYALPIRGRISMDLVICDLKNVPKEQYPKPGEMIEIIGPHQSLDALAQSAGTISYDILTSLGARYKRIYIQS